MEGSAPEEEILSVLDVPRGKMGLVIGKRGTSILSIKESCKYISHLYVSLCVCVPFLVCTGILKYHPCFIYFD